MNNFRIWMENNSKRICGEYRFRLAPNTTRIIEEWLIEPGFRSGDPEQEDLSRYVRDNITFIGDAGGSELNLPVYVRHLPVLKSFLEETRSYLVRHKSRGIQKIYDTIRQAYIRVASLNDIAIAADPKWQLLNAIDNNDLDKWLVYADHIEEMGEQRNSYVIRRVLR